MPQKRRKASIDGDDDPSPTGTPAGKRRKKSQLNYDPVSAVVVCLFPLLNFRGEIFLVF